MGKECLNHGIFSENKCPICRSDGKAKIIVHKNGIREYRNIQFSDQEEKEATDTSSSIRVDQFCECSDCFEADYPCHFDCHSNQRDPVCFGCREAAEAEKELGT